MPITPFFAAVFAVLYVFLSIGVIKHRFTKGISLGSAQDSKLETAIRVHANFAEYVPLSLLLLWFVETITLSQTLVLVMGIVLLLARIAHVLGMHNMKTMMRFRQLGVLATFAVILTCAGVLFWNYLPL